MSTQIKAANYTDHGHLKLKAMNHFPHVADEQIVPLIVHEFAPVAAEMPIVFVKDKETGSFQAVALLGFQQGENLFEAESGWRGSYVPAIITHHPFALMPVPENENQFQLAIVEPSALLSETEGEALFDEQGIETEYLIKRKEALGRYYENSLITADFIAKINDLELLQPQSLSLDFNGQKININGLYLIDEQKLKALSDEAFLELRHRGYLVPIYAHLNSINQLHNLARLKANK